MSKLGNIIHAQDIAKRMDPFVHGITANSVNPGMFIDTPLLRNTSIHWLLAKLGKFTKLTRTPEQVCFVVTLCTRICSLIHLIFYLGCSRNCKLSRKSGTEVRYRKVL